MKQHPMTSTSLHGTSSYADLVDLGRRLYADVFHFSLPSLLRYEDRNSMAFSIERISLVNSPRM